MTLMPRPLRRGVFLSVGSMERSITIISEYACSPLDLWKSAISFDDLQIVVGKLIQFRNLPTGSISGNEGEINVDVSLFGALPFQPYSMQLAEFDERHMSLTSFEHGMGVKTWRHKMQVSATDHGARLTDTVTIDAGFRTWPVVLWARFLYRSRIPRRRKLLADRLGNQHKE